MRSNNGIHLDVLYVKLLLFIRIILNCDLSFDSYNFEHYEKFRGN